MKTFIVRFVVFSILVLLSSGCSNSKNSTILRAAEDAIKKMVLDKWQVKIVDSQLQWMTKPIPALNVYGVDECWDIIYDVPFWDKHTWKDGIFPIYVPENIPYWEKYKTPFPEKNDLGKCEGNDPDAHILTVLVKVQAIGERGFVLKDIYEAKVIDYRWSKDGVIRELEE